TGAPSRCEYAERIRAAAGRRRKERKIPRQRGGVRRYPSSATGGGTRRSASPLGRYGTESRGGIPRFGERAPRIRLPSAANTRDDRKSTRLNSSHVKISYAVFCLKKTK